MTLSRLFSVALRRYRERAGMSQEELAKTAGLDRTYVSQLERGLKSPTLTTLDKLATCLHVRARHLIRDPDETAGPKFPADCIARKTGFVAVSRGDDQAPLPSACLTLAINVAHDLIDDLCASDLDIAAILGLRNLGAFVGELVAGAIARTAGTRLVPNPHQDGHPDLLLMDEAGRTTWNRPKERTSEKAPFSPFLGGGIEVKATCGSVPTPASCRDRGIDRPDIGDTRIGCLMGYDWKARHRETNNLVGILRDFIEGRPRVAAMFHSSEPAESDWGKVVRPRAGGGRTTSVSIMNREGVRKMYEGWLFVLSSGGYREFLNRRNKGGLVPSPS